MKLDEAVPLNMVTGSKKLFDVITRAAGTTMKRLMVEIMVPLEAFNRDEISNFSFASGHDNPSDGLTKPGACLKLNELTYRSWRGAAPPKLQSRNQLKQLGFTHKSESSKFKTSPIITIDFGFASRFHSVTNIFFVYISAALKSISYNLGWKFKVPSVSIFWSMSEKSCIFAL